MSVQSFQPITHKQIAFIDRLWSERNTEEINKPQLDHLSKYAASSLIEYLLTLPHRSTESSQAPAVAEGRYAVEFDGVLRFYVVQHGRGRWDGRTFVQRQVSDEEMRISFAEQRQALAKIAEDPREALVRYGHELGMCGVCGRTLTDEASRAAGIGPICTKRF